MESEEKRDNAGKEKESQPRSSKVLIYLYVLIVLSALGYALWFFLQKPAMGTVRVGTEETKEAAFDRSQEKKRYEGKYLSFSYSGTYEEKTHTLPVKNPVKESIFLSNSDLEGRKIAVMVEERPNGGLEESPSFQMRMMEEDIYQSESFSLNDFEGIIFSTDKSIFEQSAYFRYEGNIVTVTLTSALTDKGLKEELVEVVKSLHLQDQK